MKILLIEDDKIQAGSLGKALLEIGHDIEWAVNGKQGIAMATTRRHDGIILDVLLPDMDGLHVVKALRSQGVDAPVLILSILAGVEDRIEGLNAGADDYLPKPYSIEELDARLRALQRRKRGAAARREITLGDLKLDFIGRRAFRGAREITLTCREFELLELFMRNPGKTLSRTYIVERIWDINFRYESNVVDVFVNHLRRKIEKRNREKLIHTVKGVGYRFSIEESKI